MLLSHLREALAAVDRTVRLRLKRNSGLAAAGSTGGREELAGTAGSVLARIAAVLAALGLILEALFRIEFLLTGGENELCTALFALLKNLPIGLYCAQLLLKSLKLGSRASLRRIRCTALSMDFSGLFVSAAISA